MLRSLGVVLLFELFESRALTVPTYCQQFFELSCCWCLWAISRNIFASNAPPNCQLSEKVASSSRNVRTGDPKKNCRMLAAEFGLIKSFSWRYASFFLLIHENIWIASSLTWFPKQSLVYLVDPQFLMESCLEIWILLA